MGRTAAQIERRLKFMRDHFPEAMFAVPPELVQSIPCLPDPKDFPAECLSQYGLVCQTPDEFLVHQYHLNPEVVLEKLDAQAAGIRKQRQDVLDRLRNPVPSFTCTVEKGGMS
jgi:hypothetical protein